MKHGFIAWDREKLPVSALEGRLERVRGKLTESGLPALLVYCDVARSFEGRYLTNFMPYWNRSLILVPRDEPPVLLCGLSPRVYPWIRSMTMLEEIRPASSLKEALSRLCAERGWERLGVLGLARLPREIEVGVEMEDLALDPDPDRFELELRRHAAGLARNALREFTSAGDLERSLRLAGAEDLVVQRLGNSVKLAVEYCGHWARVTRCPAGHPKAQAMRALFDAALRDPGLGEVEELDGGFVELEVAATIDGEALRYGDTCWREAGGLSVL